MSGLSCKLVVMFAGLMGAVCKLSKAGSLNIEGMLYNFGSLSISVENVLSNSGGSTNNVRRGGIVLEDGVERMAACGLEYLDVCGHSLVQIESARKYEVDNEKLENNIDEKGQLDNHLVDGADELENDGSIFHFIDNKNLGIEPIEVKTLTKRQRDGENVLVRSNTAVAVSKVEKRLTEVVHTSKRLRWRISLSTTCLGFVGLALTCGMAMLSGTGSGALYFAIAGLFAPIMALGIMPTDGALIRIVILCVVAYIILYLVTAVQDVVDLFSGTFEKASKSDEDVMMPVCSDDTPQIGCTIHGTMVFTVVAAFIWLGSLLPLLATHNITKVYDFKAQHGFRYNDSEFKVSARAALERFWLVSRVFAFVTGVQVMVTASIYKGVEDQIFWLTDEIFIHEMIHGASWIISSAAITPYRRGRILAFLTAMSAEGEAMCAASVAALLGGHDAHLCFELAKKNFRSISFDKLEEDDFANNGETGETNRLFGVTDETQLGKCDVFISHSWSDNGKKKFKALRTWSRKFKDEHNREPKLWLDKACINQKNIADDLLGLPVYLAGCNELLIIAGPSYTGRLWCIIEVFTFLKMGGSIDRITIVAIDVERDQDLATLFDHVDVSESECYKEEDQQRLLGIVQTGFGNFEQFNKILRGVFHQRVLVSAQSGYLPSIKSRRQTIENVVQVHPVGPQDPITTATTQ